MKRTRGRTQFMAAVAALSAIAAAAALSGCATTGGQTQAGVAKDGYPTTEIAALERSLAGTPAPQTVPKLLLERGHAYLLEGENMLKTLPDTEERRKHFERFGGYFLRAINDFETIVDGHPNSDAAAEAMYHLGVVYDYPNIWNTPLAMGYYRRTVERYPDSEWAAEARKAIAGIEELMRRMKAGHGI